VIAENKEAFRRIGVEVGDIGTHSAQKHKYIKYEAAGDQFFGCTLCGLHPLSISFSVSPPIFDLGNAGIVELDSWIHATMRGSRDITNNLFQCFRYVFVVVLFIIVNKSKLY
jgi:hypothetical protein